MDKIQEVHLRVRMAMVEIKTKFMPILWNCIYHREKSKHYQCLALSHTKWVAVSLYTV